MCIRSDAWQLNVDPEVNSQCGGFGSVCCLFTSECLSLEAKSVRFGSGELLRRLEDEDTAVRGSADALRCAHAY